MQGCNPLPKRVFFSMPQRQKDRVISFGQRNHFEHFDGTHTFAQKGNLGHLMFVCIQGSWCHVRSKGSKRFPLVSVIMMVRCSPITACTLFPVRSCQAPVGVEWAIKPQKRSFSASDGRDRTVIGCVQGCNPLPKRVFFSMPQRQKDRVISFGQRNHFLNTLIAKF